MSCTLRGHSPKASDRRGAEDGNRSIAAQSAEPGEDVLADYRIHVARVGVLEAIPAVILGPLLAVFPVRKEALLHRLLFAIGLQFFSGFLLVQTLQKADR